MIAGVVSLVKRCCCWDAFQLLPYGLALSNTGRGAPVFQVLP